MMRFNTLRARFALWTAGLLLAALAGFSLFIYFYLANGLDASLNNSLLLSSIQATAAIDSDNGVLNFSEVIPHEEISSDNEEINERALTIRALNLDGAVQHASGPYSDLPVSATSLRAALAQQSTFSTVADPLGRASIRFYTVPIIQDGHVGGIIEIAQSMEEIRETLAQLRASLLIAIPLLVAIAALGGYLLAKRALLPIDHITRTARNISADDLSARLQLAETDDEVGRLAATFDQMLARLDDSFQRERQFTADASHELRTPLTAMQAILGVMRTEARTVADYDQALDDISEQADHLRYILEELLRLARDEKQKFVMHERIDLSTLLDDITDSLRPLADAKALTLTYTTALSLEIIGDRDSLIRLFVNLLDNAVKYTRAGNIAVNAFARATMIVVIIADTGIGIGEEHLPRIFNRFYRVDASRSTSGTGLGLAIAQDIAQSHDGEIDVTSVLGQGTTFTVSLPKFI